jgi:tetratricopeptide (TPR) repeat protein
LVRRGFARSRTHKYDEALKDLNEAIRLGPNSAEAYYFRAVTWQAKGDNARAMADFRHCVDLDPSFGVRRIDRRPKTRGSDDTLTKMNELFGTIPLEHVDERVADKPTTPGATAAGPMTDVVSAPAQKELAPPSSRLAEP